MSRRIGVVGIIITDRKGQAPLVNKVLTEYGDIIVGRMGIPYHPKELNIISLIINGSTDEVGALTGKLGSINGVKVKSALTDA
jgi:putative iron-only hydrogenase system regulator